MSPKTDVITQFYAAINRNDMQAVIEYFDPDIERIEPEGFATGGTYRGLAEVQAHISQGRGTWAEGSCEPEKLLKNGDKVVAYVHVRVRQKGSVEWIEGRFADGFVVRNDKVIQFRSFGERAEALKWADIKD